MLTQQIDQRYLISKVTSHQLQIILDVSNAFEVHGASAPHHADHIISFAQEQLSEVATILTSNSGNEGTLSHEQSLVMRGV